MTDSARTIRPRLPGAGFLLGLMLLGLAGCERGTSAAGNGADGEAAQADAEAGPEMVTLDSAAVATAGIRLAAVDTVSSTSLPVTGSITYDADRVSHIGARTEGRIVALRAEIGQRVAAGQVLAVLESPEVGQLRSQEHEAEALLEIATENYAREQRLEAQGISSRKELLDARSELRRSEASLQSARERLRLLGAGHGEGGQFGVTAPFGGVVVQRDANRGEMASPTDRLFTVADLSRVWVVLNIFERDLSRVAVGQPASVTATAFPGRTFPGRIVYVGAVLDARTRTVPARVEVPNRDGALRPGMFATATVQVSGEAAERMVVRRDAVQEVEGRQAVFVRGGAPGTFVVRPVTLGEMVDSARVEIRSGLSRSDSVVVDGAFMLRSELASSEIGEHGH